LPGSDTDPAQHVRHAAYAAYVVGAFSGVIGIVAVVTGSTLLANLGAGIGGIVTGLIYVVLGFIIWRGSAIASGATFGLYLLDSLATVGMTVSSGTTPSVFGILLRIFILGMLWRGFTGARKLEKRT
jgi:hypothetical protein